MKINFFLKKGKNKKSGGDLPQNKQKSQYFSQGTRGIVYKQYTGFSKITALTNHVLEDTNGTG